MATKTGTELKDAVKSHIGDRNNGKIGSLSVDSAVRDSINRALYDIVRKHSPKELEEIAQINVVDSNYIYNMPSTNTDLDTIKIKNILAATIQKVGEDTVNTLIRISARQRFRAFPDVSNNNPGYPSHYIEFGVNNSSQSQVRFYPYPNGSYTVTIYANAWPPLFDDNNMGNAHPLDEYMNDLVENFAVADCFLKLEQIDDYSIFMSRYERSLKRTVGAILTKPDLDFPTQGVPHYANLANQAFSGDYTGEAI
tara:strand:+ start:12146 stop:12904 length:759 start_codon:yes stop_codon:yes gene_type:complete